MLKNKKHYENQYDTNDIDNKIDRDYMKNKINNINKIILNLEEIYNQNILEGGSDENITIPLKKYKKFKQFVKKAKKTIKNYKNIAQSYYDSYNFIFVNYMVLLNLLKKQKQLLEEKQKDFEKLSKDFTTGKDKISMLETMIGGLEKVVSKTTNLDLEVKNKVNQGEITLTANSKINSGSELVKVLDEKILFGGFQMGKLNTKNSHKKMVGGMNYDEFEQAINTDLEDLNRLAEELEADNKFIEEKIGALHDKVKNIMVDTEDLLNIRLSIEWLVNQLEKKIPEGEVSEQVAQAPPEEIDYKQLYDKLKGTIDKVKQKQKAPEIAQYIRDLEGMANYIQEFILSSKDTLKSMPENKKIEMLETLKKIHGINENFLNEQAQGQGQAQGQAQEQNVGQVGGKKKLKGGGRAINDYICINRNISNNLLKIYNQQIQGKSIQFLKNDDSLIQSIQDLGIPYNPDSNDEYKLVNDKQDKLYQIFQLSIELDKKFKQVKGNLNVWLQLYNQFVEQDPESEDNIMDFNIDWDNLYESKETDYYFKMKELKVLNILNQEPPVNEVKVKNILSGLTEQFKGQLDISEKLNIYFNNQLQTQSDVLYLLNNTLIFLFHLDLLLIFNIYTISLSSNTKVFDDDLNVVYQNIILSYINLPKSEILFKNQEFYNSLRGGKFVGGGFDFKTKELTGITVKDNKKIPKFMFDELLSKFTDFLVSHIDKKIEGNITELIGYDVNEKFIDDNVESIKEMKSLYQMISNMIGKPVSTPATNQKSDTNLNINDVITQIIQYKAPDTESKSNLTQSNSLTTVSKPRLDTYKDKLFKCADILKPYYEQAVQLEKALAKYVPENSINDTTLNLSRLGGVLKSNIKIGINSYINVIPMIFFTIEFPPIAYKNNPCKFNFTYNTQKQLVNYNSPKDLTKCFILDDKTKQIIQTNKPIKQPTHQAFLDSQQNDTTQDLMEDPVIGLNKLIDLGSEKNTPTQKTINMMFALGASGTGKTTRYFGKSDASNPKDIEGIIPTIIQNATEKESDGKVEVSMSYFVCYGRTKFTYTDLTSPVNDKSNDFDEFLIFANIELVNGKMVNTPTQTPFDNEDFFVYKQNFTNDTTATNYTNDTTATNYTNFYTNLVSRKMTKIDFSSVTNYLENGGPYQPPSQPTSQNSTSNKSTNYNFREIIENNSEIWYDVRDTSKMSGIFENMIKAQKVIHTVLPTKNNMESSRGHTCLLIRIREGSTYKYFPLFDMAGTENTDGMTKFFNQFNKPKQMDKLVSVISELSRDNAIFGNEDPETEIKEFTSLAGLVKNNNVNQYLQGGSKRGGAKEKFNVNEDFKESGKKIQEYTGNTELITKIINEGYYINHTIGMMIYVAKCIGCSINSTCENCNDEKNKKDDFDNIQNDVIEQMNQYVWYYKDKDSLAQVKTSGTRVLVDGLDFNTILSKSTIWMQILFSFLYWNEENKETFEKMIEDCVNKKPEKNNTLYLREILDNKEKNSLGMTTEYFGGVNIETFFKKMMTDFEGKEIDVNLNNVEQNIKIFEDKISLSNKTILILTKDNQLIVSTNDDKKTKTNKTNDETESLINDFNVILKKKDKDLYANICNFDYVHDMGNQEKINSFINEIFVVINKILKLSIKCTNAIQLAIYNKLKVDIKNNLKNNECEAIIIKFITYIFNMYFKNEYEKTKMKKEDIDIIIDNKISDIFIKISKIFSNTNDVIAFNNNKLQIQINSKSISFEEIINYYNNLLFCYKSGYSMSKQESLLNTRSTRTSTSASDIPLSTEQMDQQELQIQNQINRIRDGRIGAAKMVLMHVVTGQEFKYPMVMETIGLTKTLFESTEIKLKSN